MELDSEMLARQIRRMTDKTIGKLEDIGKDITTPTDVTLYHLGFLAALDRVLIMIGTLPEGAK